jgi:hypothetical protein
MAGLQATQLSTVINAAGDPSPVEQSGCVTNVPIVCVVVGASHASYSRTIAAPMGVETPLVETATSCTFEATVAGPHMLVVQGWSGAVPGTGSLEATYILPLAIRSAAVSTFVGPVEIYEAAPNQVTAPRNGGTLFPDSTAGNDPAWKYPDDSTAKIALRSTTRYLTTTPISPDGGWTTTDGHTYTCGAATDKTLYWPLDLADGATISSIVLRFKGASGHSVLPATMPAVSLLEFTEDGDSDPVGSAASDVSATYAAYELWHDVTLTLATPLTIDSATLQYTLTLDSEDGTGARAGGKVASVMLVGTGL